MARLIDFKNILHLLRTFYRNEDRLPSYSELQDLCGYKSKGGVARLVAHLIKRGIVKKDTKGKLIPTSLIKGGIKLVGEVQAGFPSPAEEELIDIISLDEFLIEKPAASYLVKVTGESMIDAGIHPGDLVIVERGKDPHNGDIVVAQVDGDWTMKYFYKKGRVVTLKAANKKYPPITPSQELVIGGVVIACLRKYSA